MAAGTLALWIGQGCATIGGLDELEFEDPIEDGGGGAGAGGTGGDASADVGSYDSGGSAGKDAADAGGGTAGAGGQAGAGGNAGSAGASGGSGGAAGEAGTGGVGGAAGTSGAGGVAGASGTSGAGGVAGAAGTSGAGGVGGAAGTSGAGGAGGASGTAGSGGATSCGTGQLCAPAVPAAFDRVGWLDSTGAVNCAASETQLDLYSSTDLNGAKTICACGCGAPGNAFCSSEVECFKGSSCSGISTSANATDTCSAIASPGGTTNRCWASAPTIDSKSGCPVSVNISLSPITATQRTCSVAAANAKTCSNGGACVPEPTAKLSGPCIMATGVMSCPASYPIHLALFSSYVDTRDCSQGTCSCGTISGTCSCAFPQCGVAISDLSTCGSVPTLLPATGQCALVSFGTASWGVKLAGYSAAGGACAPAGQPSPIGSVVGSGPLTVCCVN